MKRLLPLALLTAVVTMMSSVTRPCHAQALKIGVVRFTALINGYKGTLAEHDRTIKKREMLRQQEIEKRDELTRLNAKLKQHTPDSEAYKKTEDELRQKRADLETWKRMKNEEVLSDATRLMREIYQDIETGAADFGRKNGYALILKEDDLNLAEATIPEQLSVNIALRKVLYYDPSLDITDALLKHLNESYDARKK